MTEKITREEIEKRLAQARSGLAEHERYTDHVNGELRTTSKAFVKHFQKEIALCTLALQAEAMQPRPMSEFSPLGPTVVSQVAYVTNGKHYGEAVRSHDEPRWVWTQTRHWCDPQPTHFYSLTSLPEPRR